MSQGAHNLAAAARLWSVWVAQGLRHVVVAPGSRSAPLTVAAARTAGLTSHVVIDERSAAFFALGLAKAGDLPVALVCTSGTAAANFAPAVWEASLSHTPLLVVTADRPPELHECGAAQTIRQRGLFGAAVRADFVLPVPDGASPLDGLALRAWAAAVVEHGPVHLNVPFREPLLPPAPEPLAAEEPPPRVFTSRAGLDPAAAKALASLLGEAKRPLLVLGPEAIAPHEREPLSAWLRTARIPAVADIGSGARYGAAAAHVIGCAESVLRAVPPTPPDLVVNIGLLPTSKTLQTWLAASGARHVAVGPRHDWVDPLYLVSDAVVCTAGAFLDAVTPPAHDGAYLAAWHGAAAEAMRRVSSLLTGDFGARLPESRLGAAISGMLPAEGVLFLSNSMPIREADAFAQPSGADVRVYVNRGVNGIDGIVSTALGCAAAEGRPLLAVIGDVAMQHDLGGLALARSSGARGVILIVNNAGGAIFEHLPVRRHEDVFEPYFAAPQAIDFEAAAKAFGLRYAVAETPETAGHAVRTLLGGPLSIVELRVTRDAQGADRAKLWHALQHGVWA